MLDALLWTALAVCLTTSALILLLLALRPLLGEFLSPRFLTALWALLALRLMLPFAVPLPETAVLFKFYPPAQHTASAAPDEAPNLSDGTALSPVGGQIPSSDATFTDQPAFPSENGDVQTPQNISDSIFQEMSQAGTGTALPWWADFAVRLRHTLDSLSPVRLLLGLWLLGSGIRLVFELFFILRFRRSLRRSCTALQDPVLSGQIRAAAASLGLKKYPAVYSCTQISGPMLVGFLRPILLLPDAGQYAPEDLDCMLRHELTHYRCHHMLYKLMLLVLCCLQWWNPAAYLLRRQADRDLELACDSWALSGKTAVYRARYGRALLNSITSSRSLGDGCSSCFHREGVKVMRRRLMNIFGKSGRSGSPAALAGILALCIVVSGCVAPAADSITAVSSVSDTGSLFDSAPPAEIHEISTAEELLSFAEGVNAGLLDSSNGDWWVLTDDIDLTGIDWEPIGKVISPLQNQDFGFYHPEITRIDIHYELPLILFDGQGHTVTGMTCFQGSSFGYGGFFFTVAPGSVIRNLNVEGSVTAYTAGGLIARADGLIENCSFSGQVTGYGSVGGFAGAGSATIRYCRVDADVAGSNGVGGFIGHTGNCDIYRCYATGTVSGYSNLQISELSGMYYVPGLDIIQEIGGFAGMGAGELPDCIADTTVACYDVTNFLGSFVGTSNTNTVSGCYYNNEKNQNWSFGTIQLRLIDGELSDGPYPPNFRPTTIREDTPGWTPLGISSAEIAQMLETFAEEYQPLSPSLEQASAIYQPRDLIGEEGTYEAALLRRKYLDPISCSGILETAFSPDDLSALGQTEGSDPLILPLHYLLNYDIIPERIQNSASYVSTYGLRQSQEWVEDNLTRHLPCDAETLRSLAGSCYVPEESCYILKTKLPTRQILARVTGYQQNSDLTLTLDYTLYKVPENASETWQEPILSGTGRITLQPYDNDSCRYLSNEYTPVEA